MECGDVRAGKEIGAPSQWVGLVDVMDAKSLPKVRMPNRDGFIADPRPDVGEKARKPN